MSRTKKAQPYGVPEVPPVKHPEAWGACMECLAELPRQIVMGLRPCLEVRWKRAQKARKPQGDRSPGASAGSGDGAPKPEDG